MEEELETVRFAGGVNGASAALSEGCPLPIASSAGVAAHLEGDEAAEGV